MREVSCRATSQVIEALEGAGACPERLVEGLPVSLDHLRHRGERIDWDVFARICDRIEEACAGKLTLEQVGARMVEVPSNDFFRRVGKLVVRPLDLYRIGERLIAPELFAN